MINKESSMGIMGLLYSLCTINLVYFLVITELWLLRELGLSGTKSWYCTLNRSSPPIRFYQKLPPGRIIKLLSSYKSILFYCYCHFNYCCYHIVHHHCPSIHRHFLCSLNALLLIVDYYEERRISVMVFCYRMLFGYLCFRRVFFGRFSYNPW